MSNTYDFDDPAHEEDMRILRREQLRGDISPEEANEEYEERLASEYDDPEQCDLEEDWEY